MKSKINLNSGHFLLLFIIIVIAFFSIRDVIVKNKIKTSSHNIVVKFTSRTRLPKTTKFYFTYLVNGKKITTANSGIKYSILNTEAETKIINNLKINCFYLAKYDSEYPNTIIVNPNIQVTDTIAILKAGFSHEDL